MANETTKIDANQQHTIAGVTYDANEEVMNLTTNPVDKRLRVDSAISNVDVVSVDGNSQLKVTPYHSSGSEGNCIIDCQTYKPVEIESLGGLKTITPTRLVGTVFNNGTKDTNFWNETVTGSGSVTQSGEIILATGTTANSTAKYQSVRKARKVNGAANQFRAVGRCISTIEDDNIMRIGAYDTNNGFFMQFDGTTFGVGTRTNESGSPVDTIVTNGNFNGTLGATISFEENEYTRINIEYNSRAVRYFLNGYLIHTISATTDPLIHNIDLPVTVEIINENGNTTNNSYALLFASIVRLGDLVTQSTSYYQSGQTAGVVLKYGAGNIRGLVISGVVNNSVVTLYDNTAASGTVIWSSGAMGSQTQPFDLNFNSIPFGTGLTLVISGANSNVLVEYE